MIQCFIGLGSNLTNELGTPQEHLMTAIKAFEDAPYFKNVRSSSIYISKAYGVTDQPDFLNAVLAAQTTLLPLQLLDFCQNLENQAGRVRVRHWGERSLDVDILLYADECISSERLTVPHRELFLRNFVLIPLLQIQPDLCVAGQSLKGLPAAQDNTGIELFSPAFINK